MGVKILPRLPSRPARLRRGVGLPAISLAGKGEGESFWEKIYKEMTFICQEENASWEAAQTESRSRNCKFMVSLVVFVISKKTFA